VLYRARQLRLDRPVALKVVGSDVARDPVVRERLRREARAVAAMDHPNVVPLYEAGEHDGTIFVATRWIDGTELGALIRQRGALTPEEAGRTAGQLAGALETAHERGVVHRDVKPSNVIVTAEGHAYLTDFGLARRAQTAPGLTRNDQMMGTIDYIAPEQIEGSEPDARGDVYALGCVLFEMLAGLAPFADQQGAMAKMWAQVNAEPPALADRRSDVPPALEAAMRQALAKDPAARPTAARFGSEVLRAVGEPG
jgi:serine/threonine-protein kinase